MKKMRKTGIKRLLSAAVVSALVVAALGYTFVSSAANTITLASSGRFEYDADGNGEIDGAAGDVILDADDLLALRDAVTGLDSSLAALQTQHNDYVSTHSYTNTQYNDYVSTHSYTNTQYNARVTPKDYEIIDLNSQWSPDYVSDSRTIGPMPTIIRFSNGYKSGEIAFGSGTEGTYCSVRRLDDDSAYGKVDYSGEGYFLIANVTIGLYVIKPAANLALSFNHSTTKKAITTLHKGDYYRISYDYSVVTALKDAICILVEPQ